MDIIYNESPKAKKKHQCDWCDKIIMKGSIYKKFKFVDSGEIYTSKYHVCCNAFINNNKDYCIDDMNFCHIIVEVKDYSPQLKWSELNDNIALEQIKHVKENEQ